MRCPTFLSKVPPAFEHPTKEELQDLKTVLHDDWVAKREKDHDDSVVKKLLYKSLAYPSTSNAKRLTVLKLRFGIDHCDSYTLEEVAKFFGVSREYIRHVEYSGLRKFRAYLEGCGYDAKSFFGY